MESDYHWLITIGLVTSSVIAVTANFFLLVVFCRRRGLRTVPNRFVINLLITNLLSSILLIPLLLVDRETNSDVAQLFPETNQSVEQFSGLIIQEEIHTDNFEIIETSENIVTESISIARNSTNQVLLCYFAQSTTSFVCTASIFSILLIGINQYFGVIHSLRYHFYINKCRSTIFIGCSWFVALFCAVLSSVTYSDCSLWHFCENKRQPSDTIRVLNTVYAFSYFFLVILAPFVAICVIYVCIYTAAHQNSERMRRSTSAPLNPNMEYIQVPVSREANRNGLPKVHSAPTFSHMTDNDSFKEVIVEEEQQKPRNNVSRTFSDRGPNNFITTLKHKISNSSVFKYREETRAAKISILVIFMVLVCYIPYGVTLILSSECIKANTSQIFNYLSLILLVFSNILSPFLFGYRNKRVKREICKMFGFIQKEKLPIVDRPRKHSMIKNRSLEDVNENYENQIINEPFIPMVPEVIVTCKPENERKSILKRVCDTSNWPSYKKCNFMTVPDSCISGEARGSFSSASTQISNEE